MQYTEPYMYIRYINFMYIHADIMLEIDKEVNKEDNRFATMAKLLQEKYYVLLAKIQADMAQVKIKQLKNSLNSLLIQTYPGVYPDIEKYIQEINKISTSDDLFDFLIKRNFISYLHFDVLKNLFYLFVMKASKRS